MSRLPFLKTVIKIGTSVDIHVPFSVQGLLFEEFEVLDEVHNMYVPLSGMVEPGQPVGTGFAHHIMHYVLAPKDLWKKNMYTYVAPKLFGGT